MDAVLSGPRPAWLSSALLLASTVMAWWLYVPIHELLHALGCRLGGGQFEELQIAPVYGGHLLGRMLPWVTAGGTHAGRLTGLDTGGSDAVYLLTDFAPFLLTITAALPLLRRARARHSPYFFGPGMVLMTAPLVSITGDFYEMGSILVGPALGLLPGCFGLLAPEAIRTDDLVALLGDFPTLFPADRLWWALAILSSAALGWLLATATLALASAPMRQPRKSADSTP